jgi:hypothetical protein
MKHRGITLNTCTLAAIDDVISRGAFDDWLELYRAVSVEPDIREDIISICNNYIDDPSERCHRFWKIFIESLGRMDNSYGDIIKDWDNLFSVASNTDESIENAVIAGCTAAAIVADHRISIDADGVLSDLIDDFDQISTDLEMLCGWNTAILKNPDLNLDNFDGITTEIRQIIRKKPLETQQIFVNGKIFTVPTPEEMLRIKSFFILKRNASRDYIDFAALSVFLGSQGINDSLSIFDDYYAVISKYDSPVKQLITQLVIPLPHDKKKFSIKDYKYINNQLNDWSKINKQCQNASVLLMHIYGQMSLKIK